MINAMVHVCIRTASPNSSAARKAGVERWQEHD
jgi:hypothetical protein